MHDLEMMKQKTKCALELLFNSDVSYEQKAKDITAYINPNKYIQHSPELEDGLQGLMKLVKHFDETLVGYSIDVKLVLAEGDHSMAHCLYRFGPDDRGKAIVEIFRFENNMMVEHWDVIQEVPETEATGNANGNGMF